jgi:hypothetical protein
MAAVKAGARTPRPQFRAVMSRIRSCTCRTDQVWPKNCAAISGT